MTPLLTGFPFGGGGVPKATITSTTGSPSIDTSSRPGKTIYTFTGSGSVTVGAAGTCELLIAGGGGAGGRGAGGTPPGGGGAGGLMYDTASYLSAGTLTVTVGAGGTLSGNSQTMPGSPSAVGSYAAPGGGGGGAYINPSGVNGQNGGSGGGGQAPSGISAGTGLSGQGNAGGGGSSNGGGGGGSNSAGGDGTAGTGRSISITGSAVTYAAGGAGGSGSGSTAGTAGGANTGNGGGGGGASGGAGSNGGSGRVIIVIG